MTGIFKILNHLRGYYRCGCKRYPYLFKLSLVIVPLNIIPIFLGTFGTLNYIAVSCGVTYFGIVLWLYLIDER